MFSHQKSSRNKYQAKKGRGGKFTTKRKAGYNSNNSNSKKAKFKYHDKQSFHNNDEEKEANGTLPQQFQESSESEDEEIHDNQISQLINSFGYKKPVAAIDSDESLSENEASIIHDNEQDLSDEALSESENDSEDEKEDLEIDVCPILEDQFDNSDPFERRILFDMSESMVTSMQACPIVYTTNEESWPAVGKLIIQLPKFEENEEVAITQSITIDKDKPFAKPAVAPTRRNYKNILSQIKQQIVKNVGAANNGFNSPEGDVLSELQKEIFGIINNYQDFYYTARSIENAELIRFSYCLHAANHITKTRNKVLHHNARLSNKDDVPEEFRDQGLVRPKVLIILPFRDSAYKVINMLITLILNNSDKGSVFNKNRFEEEFTGHELQMPKKNPKPEDYEQIFQGNSNDDFKIGLTITKKSIKLYADFYSSDIIIASPLGLRSTIGADGEPDRDFDFLNSIELLILDQCEMFLMQNFDHVLHIMDHLHLQPKDTHGTDLQRVRTWALNGLARYYRQTLIFSAMPMAEFNAIFARRCVNYYGRVRVVKEIVSGSISQVFVQLPHVFRKFESNSVVSSAEDRFKFFTTKVLPQQKDSLMKQTLVFISSYFDYVRIRNHFKREDVNFVQICEYSKEGKVARARDMFYHGDAHFLLYTERYHFFNRIRVKGIRHIVFYQPPMFAHFYNEMCNLMQEGNMNRKVGNSANMTVTILYCKYDQHQISGLVGTERATTMLHSDRNVHMLLTDGN